MKGNEWTFFQKNVEFGDCGFGYVVRTTSAFLNHDNETTRRAKGLLAEI